MGAQLYETHSGLVVLCGERAYKTKKPVITDFLDFSTPQLRERACARELDLNRRLAPDVYLGVGQLTDPTGGPAEPVLIMRRMPEQARLSAHLADPNIGGMLTALAHLLARFHDQSAHGPQIDAAGTVAALRSRWDSLISGLSQPPIPAQRAQLIRALVNSYLAGREPLFEDRIAAGHIVDGHGDLRAGDIFSLPDGFRVLDCLDFDDDLRYVDRVDDIAFLVMDLEFRGHPQLGAQMLQRYCAITGDPAPLSLRHHYIAYRAAVRAKTDCIRGAQGAVESAAHAESHVAIAVRHLRAAAVRLALVGGLPGTGKSTVARHLGDAVDATVISSDDVRHRLRASGTVSGSGGDFGDGAYRPEAKAAVYAAMLTEAKTELSQGRSVILDASWTDAQERARAAALAADTHSDLVELQCQAPERVAASRLATRRHSDTSTASSYSEATPAIATAMADRASPWPQATTIDTTAPLPNSLALALRAWSVEM